MNSPPSPVVAAQNAGFEMNRDHLKSMSIYGGSTSIKSNSNFGIASLWGVVGVCAVVFNAVKRLLPVALEPFSKGGVSVSFWVGYVSFSVLMAYAEGYKAFQKKFAPLVVKRALTLDKKASPLQLVLAAPYSMGMFHATKKRKIVSWSITAGVFLLVKIVKTLPYPYRSLVDAGVVAGLSWGGVSIIYNYIRSLGGHVPDIDPALPKTD